MATKNITAHFIDDDGNPATGLTPTIRIRDLDDNSLLITDAVCAEIGDGGYRYDFIDYDVSKAYQIRVDAGSSITYRYAFGFNKSSFYAGLSIVSTFFLNDNYLPTPALGLVPTVKIRDISDGSIVVNGAPMTEVGDGGYKYIFSAYDALKNYQIVCDAGSSIIARYSYGYNGEYIVQTMTLPFEATIDNETILSGDIENVIQLEGNIVVK